MRRMFLALVFVSVPVFGMGGEGEEKEKNEKTPVKFYGYLKLDRIEESNGQGLITLWAPKASADNQLYFTMNQTRLGVAIDKGFLGDAKFTVNVEGDFYGGGGKTTPNLRLYRAFGRMSLPSFDMCFGQDWNTHSRLYGNTLIFFYPPVGNPQYRRPQIRVVKSFAHSDLEGISVAAAIAQPGGGDLDQLGVDDGADSRMPMLQGRLAYERYKPDAEGKKTFSDFKHFTEVVPVFTAALSGHYGEEEIDESDGSDFNVETWSLVGEVAFPLWSWISFKGEAFTGANLDHDYGGILQGVNPKTGKAISASGGWGELQVKVVPNVVFHLGAGLDDPDDSDLNPGDRSKNVAMYLNAVYVLSNMFKTGFEYSHYETEYLEEEFTGSEHCSVSENYRVQFSFIVGF